MTFPIGEARLREIFPHISEDTIRKNFPHAPSVRPATSAPSGPLPDPEPQRDQAPALGGPAKGEARSLHRATVRFVGYRVRPLDPDNFAGSVKDLLDGLRHASLIHGDEPWRIILETEQVKVAHFKDERTEILIS